MAKKNSNRVSKTDTAKARKAAIARETSKIAVADTTALATSALSSGTSRFELGKRLQGFLAGAKVDGPLYAARYNAGRRSISIGYIAAYFRRHGDNREDDALLSYAAEVMDCAKPDAQKIADGQRRCTERDWQARSAARTFTSGLCAEIGVKPPVSNGGGANNRRGAGAGKRQQQKPLSPAAKEAVAKAVAKVKREAAQGLKFAPPKNMDREAFGEYALRTITMLLQNGDKVNAKTNGSIPPQVTSALVDCKAAIKSALAA